MSCPPVREFRISPIYDGRCAPTRVAPDTRRAPQCHAHDDYGYCCQLVDGHEGGHEYWPPPPKIQPITVSGAGGYLQLRGGTTSIDLDLTFAVFRALNREEIAMRAEMPLISGQQGAHFDKTAKTMMRLRPDLLQQAKELAESIASFMLPR